MPENNGGNHRRNGHRTVTIRNYVAKNQWQRGGVHDKPNKAKRQKAKQKLKKDIRTKSFGTDFFLGGIVCRMTNGLLKKFRAPRNEACPANTLYCREFITYRCLCKGFF